MLTNLTRARPDQAFQKPRAAAKTGSKNMVGTAQSLGMASYPNLEGQISDRLMHSHRSQLSEGTTIGPILMLRTSGPEGLYSSQRAKHPAS